MGTSKFNAGVTLRLTSRGSRNTPSRFLLLKPEITGADLMGYLARTQALITVFWGCSSCVSFLSLGNKDSQTVKR